MVDYKKSLLSWIKSMAEMKSVTLYYPKKHVKIKTAKIRSTSVMFAIKKYLLTTRFRRRTAPQVAENTMQ